MYSPNPFLFFKIINLPSVTMSDEQPLYINAEHWLRRRPTDENIKEWSELSLCMEAEEVLGAYNPKIMDMIVLLPQPDGPTRAVDTPASKDAVRFRKTG